MSRSGGGKRMKKSRTGLMVAISAMALLMVSPSASAKSGYFVWPAGRESQVSVKGTNGFDVTVVRTAGWIELVASNGSTSASYVIRRRRRADSGDGIHATFPGLGRVSLRFRPSGKVKREPSFCRGRASIQRFGVFRGSIRFEGELGYTRVVTSRGRGYTYRSFREVCKDSGHSTSTPGYSLNSEARTQGRAVSFSAFKPIPEWFYEDETTYLAGIWERRRGMIILRSAFASMPRNGLAVAGPLNRPDSVTVAPPPPFSGTASFHAPPGAPAEWTGTLAVDMPGAGTVPLTGPGFESELCLNRRCVGRTRILQAR